MTKKELIEKLSKFSDNDEVEIYIHGESNPLCKDNEREKDSPSIIINYEYILADFEVTQYHGWEGLITLEPNKIIGC